MSFTAENLLSRLLTATNNLEAVEKRLDEYTARFAAIEDRLETIEIAMDIGRERRRLDPANLFKQFGGSLAAVVPTLGEDDALSRTHQRKQHLYKALLK